MIECALCRREVPDHDAVFVEEDGDLLAYCSEECAEAAREGALEEVAADEGD